MTFDPFFDAKNNMIEIKSCTYNSARNIFPRKKKLVWMMVMRAAYSSDILIFMLPHMI